MLSYSYERRLTKYIKYSFQLYWIVVQFRKQLLEILENIKYHYKSTYFIEKRYEKKIKENIQRTNYSKRWIFQFYLIFFNHKTICQYQRKVVPFIKTIDLQV